MCADRIIVNKVQNLWRRYIENIELISTVMMVGAKCYGCIWRGHKAVLGFRDQNYD